MSDTVDEQFEALLAFARDERGFDFTGYKRPSLRRRIGKRMQEVGLEDWSAYREHLERHPDEFPHLFDTILINVTAFFRDDLAWEYLRREIVPRIVEHRDGDQIRIWSTGCATGEEAYSLAMVFAEALGDDEFRRRTKIYATDVDAEALAVGRHALYPAKRLEPVPEELRERYFERSNSSCVFRGDLRRSVIFGRHDLVQDPPISKIDLLLSRNTLMYFTAETQRVILANLHFALREDGFLFLGKSEALASRASLFVPVDVRRRVFAKLPGRAPLQGKLEIAAEAIDDLLAQPAPGSVIRDAGFDAVPVSQIVLDPDGQVVMANLQARAAFGLTPRDIGRPFRELEVSFRPVELRTRVEQVGRDRHAISLRDIEWHVGSDVRFVDVQIAPLIAATGEAVGVGISFVDVTRYRRLREALEGSKRDVEAAYEELQSTVEELETTNEELQSTNEELETTNEELQSTNEELETMNEELHSTNEELETMNDELAQRSLELNSANTFLEAVLASLDEAVVVVDRDLRVEAWNGGARDLWGLRADEALGKHLLNLDIGLPVDKLRQPIRKVLADGGGSLEVTLPALSRRGREIRCQVRLAPLRAGHDGSTGVILMMQPEQS